MEVDLSLSCTYWYLLLRVSNGNVIGTYNWGYQRVTLLVLIIEGIKG